jgi:hypothetical protein
MAFITLSGDFSKSTKGGSKRADNTTTVYSLRLYGSGCSDCGLLGCGTMLLYRYKGSSVNRSQMEVKQL